MSKQKHGVYKEYSFLEKYMTKDGTLKRKKMSKDERVKAMACCTHHYRKKNGNIKSMTIDNMDGTVTCRICAQRFTASAAVKKELKNMTNTVLEQLNLGKWIGQAGGIDDKTMSYLIATDVHVRKLPKILTRIQKQYMKASSAKKKKNKGGDRFGRNSASTFGSWEAR